MRIEDIDLPSPDSYNPPATPNIVDSKVGYQLLEFLHKEKEKFPEDENIKRFIILMKKHYKVWYPKIEHCRKFD